MESFSTTNCTGMLIKRREGKRERVTQIILIHSRLWRLILIQGVTVRLQYDTLFIGSTLLPNSTHQSRKNINCHGFWLETFLAVVWFETAVKAIEHSMLFEELKNVSNGNYWKSLHNNNKKNPIHCLAEGRLGKVVGFWQKYKERLVERWGDEERRKRGEK